jgi:hypothetical protein
MTSRLRDRLRLFFVLACLPLLSAKAVDAPAGAPLPGHKIEVSDPALARQITAEGGRLIGDYGAFQLYDVPSLSPELLGRGQAQIRDEYNVITLKSGHLDTTQPEVQSMRNSVGAFVGKRMHLVQFAGPVQPGWHDALLKTGVQIVTYVPENAYLVYGDSQSIGQLQILAASAPHIQWDGAYADTYKIHPEARTVDPQGNPRTPAIDMFGIQLVADPDANDATVKLLDQLKLEPFKRNNSALNYVNIVVRINPADLPLVAAQADVVFIHPYYARREFDERQAQIVAGNLAGNSPSGPGYLSWLASKGFTQAQFTNSNFAADVSDSGLDNGTQSPNHPGLRLSGVATNSSRVIYNRLEGTANSGSTIKGCDGHGTLNSHIVCGYDDFAIGFPHTDVSGYHYGLGICPFVKVGSSVIFDSEFTFPNFANLQSKAYHDGARVSNNSWGADVNGDYDLDAQEYDALVRDAQPSGSSFPVAGNQEMVIVFAAGNAGAGAGTVGAPGSAKNVLTVGAAENVQATGTDGCGLTDSGANSANDIIFFSSRGPCADGRLKPEIVAPGTHVSGGVAQAANAGANGTADSCFNANGVCALLNGNFFPVGQQLFTISSGTSHSAPAVVGGCALLRQYFINNFNAPPSPAMTKAFLMNSARYMTGVSANDSLWSNNQGMGEMNLGFAFDGVQRLIVDQVATNLFTATGQSRTFSGSILNTNKPFRVTLAWTDAPGALTGNAYKNNLDLTVTVGGTTYKGNVFNGTNSVTGGSADVRNNVESVFLPAGVGTNFTVTITAANINSDGVPNNSSPLDQDFALVVYNVNVPLPPSVSAIQPANQTVLSGQPASFSVTATGSAPLSYQWRFNGAPIVGATTASYVIAAAQPVNAGGYSVLVTNSYGSMTSGVANLVVIPTVPLPFALNNSNVTWSTDNTNSPWYGQTNVSHDGIASAETFVLGDNQHSSLKTTLTGPATLGFWWKVSSQTNVDILTFGINASNRLAISGEVDWQHQTFYLPAGAVALDWTYTKDASNSAGLDRAFVDEVSLVTGGTAPFVTSQPVSQTSMGGTPVTFLVSAEGTPNLAYQWRHNGGDISGATSPSFTIGTPIANDNGGYSVRVTNAYGSITSSIAVLGVVPVAVAGDNSLGQLAVSPLTTNAIALAAGDWHSLALKADGTVVAWGDDSAGQSDVPPSLTGVAAISAGGYHSLALKADGRVVGWGANYDGQANPSTPVTNATAIAAGRWHSLALLSDGTVTGWGDNSAGQLDVPINLGSVIAIAARGSHSLALLSDGTGVAWGENINSEGNFVGQSSVPSLLANVVAIGAGDYHSLALKIDSTIDGWGDDSQGQIDTPPGLAGIVAIAGGGGHTVALKNNGTALAWGNNLSGQCNISPGLTNVIGIAAGGSHTLLLLGSVPGAPMLLNPHRSGNQFTVLVQTANGRNYALEYKDSITGTTWTSLPSVRGNGTMMLLTDPDATVGQRFYRVRQY